jgi:porin
MKRLVSILAIVFLYFLALDVPLFSSLARAQTDTHTHKVGTAPDRSAGEVLKDIWNRDKLTGDWRGLRTDLADHGIDIGLRLSNYWQWVADGGSKRTGRYGGTMDYRLNVDGKKFLGLWKGLSLNMHARSRFGYDVNKYAGAFSLQNTGMLMPSPGSYHQTDVTGLQITQYLPFFYGRLANITLGKIDVLDTVTMFFPSVGYGQEGFWNVNGLVTALPWFGAVAGLSLYGGYAVTVNQKYMAPETGILALGTRNVSTSWASISSSFKDGVWLAAFHRFYWDLKDKMGYFMVFAGGSTRDQASNEPRNSIEIPGQDIENTSTKQPWDIAAYLYQVFWQAEGNPNRKATLLIGGTGGPDDPQFAQWHLFGALEAYGLMASRPDDRMGVSGWYNGLSGNFKDLVSPLIDLRDAWGVELYYNFAINKWLHLTPDLQLLRNERKDDDFVVIPGIRLVMDF